MHQFETGPIRPPSEAYSILLRVSRNCPWNRCEFCMSYKTGDTKFALRSVDEVKADIDSMAYIARKIGEMANEGGRNGRLDREMLYRLAANEKISAEYVGQVAFWMSAGMQSMFLQDGDSLVMKADDIAEIITYARKTFPSVQRITTYARSKTFAKKSPDDLKKVRAAGLDRVHIGMESGSDRVLEIINKGATAEDHITGGRKAMEAGFEVSEFYMPGAGGTEFWEESARETARVLNAINPTFIRVRTCTPLPATGLYKKYERGEWNPLGEEGKVREIQLMLQNLEGITSTVVSDHMMNLIEDIEGTLPDDKERMLGIIDSFFSMNDRDRLNYIVGRRIGRYRFLSDYRRENEVSELADKLVMQFGSIDAAVLEILGQGML